MENPLKTQNMQEQQDDLIENKKFNKFLGIAVISALVLGAGYVALNLKSGSQKYDVVDLAGITRTYQEVAKQQALQDGISNEQRGQVLDNLQKKMTLLEQVINDTAQDCKCNIFVKSAIVGSFSVHDRTAEIMAKVDAKANQKPVVSPQASPSTTAVDVKE